MRSMTKINLTKESFIQVCIDMIIKDCEPNVATDITQNIEESDMLNDLYEEGCTVGYAVTAIIDDYNEFHQYNRRSLR